MRLLLAVGEHFGRNIKRFGTISGAQQLDSNLAGENGSCENVFHGLNIFIQVDLDRFGL